MCNSIAFKELTVTVRLCCETKFLYIGQFTGHTLTKSWNVTYDKHTYRRYTGNRQAHVSVKKKEIIVWLSLDDAYTIFELTGLCRVAMFILAVSSQAIVTATALNQLRHHTVFIYLLQKLKRKYL